YQLLARCSAGHAARYDRPDTAEGLSAWGAARRPGSVSSPRGPPCTALGALAQPVDLPPAGDTPARRAACGTERRCRSSGGAHVVAVHAGLRAGAAHAPTSMVIVDSWPPFVGL